ncbi:hypothetical protein Calag_0701 [Caldisphaera lagunensis DSM 15908]|uniref:HTH dtxR-type domain-containing protein n=1 Tax=Caldisphaera lagunensis (strain DSM 15908 / JCM 11604 / ANMR 0165 / IC-154) TaxID=1056495 RepID=L0A997_CALLD|nr:MarR family transcriptional regulator [Caldisphaera lagunensis]AFZ70446.1 hypothetical protein Calag_0701 [Caldisphaera lagunensis DSM 15908]
MRKSYLKVTVNLDLIAEELKRLNKRYITIKDFSRYFGISNKTSGKILKHLEKMGYVKRYSTSAYSIIGDSA